MERRLLLITHHFLITHHLHLGSGPLDSGHSGSQIDVRQNGIAEPSIILAQPTNLAIPHLP
jgi:hypothetical protein